MVMLMMSMMMRRRRRMTDNQPSTSLRHSDAMCLESFWVWGGGGGGQAFGFVALGNSCGNPSPSP